MALPARKWHTVGEYLRLEMSSVERHEFHDGEILAMSGGTYDHSLICANVVGELRARLKGSPCRVLESNMRVAIRALSRYVYADGSVVCGQPEFDPNDPDRTTILNPRVIVEVLSPSTETYDRSEKFRAYQTIQSLQQYVLVSTDRPLVELFTRQSDDRWSPAVSADLHAIAEIGAIHVELPLAEVYDGITFAPASKAHS
jgi:Uma2 family endonuclease